MPQQFYYSANIQLGDRTYKCGKNCTSCREMAASNIDTSFFGYDVRRMDKLNILSTRSLMYAEFTVDADIYNVRFLDEINKNFTSLDPNYKCTIEAVNDGFYGITTNIIKTYGDFAYPAWWWIVLSLRNPIVRLDMTFKDALGASPEFDFRMWNDPRDKGAAIRAWKRLKRGVTPNTKQMLFWAKGPVSWFYTRGKISRSALA